MNFLKQKSKVVMRKVNECDEIKLAGALAVTGVGALVAVTVCAVHSADKAGHQHSLPSSHKQGHKQRPDRLTPQASEMRHHSTAASDMSVSDSSDNLLGALNNAQYTSTSSPVRALLRLLFEYATNVVQQYSAERMAPEEDDRDDVSFVPRYKKQSKLFPFRGTHTFETMRTLVPGSSAMEGLTSLTIQTLRLHDVGPRGLGENERIT